MSNHTIKAKNKKTGFVEDIIVIDNTPKEKMYKCFGDMKYTPQVFHDLFEIIDQHPYGGLEVDEPVEESMEDRFDKLFLTNDKTDWKHSDWGDVIIGHKNVKDFITQEIAKAKEDRDRENIEKIKELLKTPFYNKDQTYDRAINEVINIIQNNK